MQDWMALQWQAPIQLWGEILGPVQGAGCQLDGSAGHWNLDLLSSFFVPFFVGIEQKRIAWFVLNMLVAMAVMHQDNNP